MVYAWSDAFFMYCLLKGVNGKEVVGFVEECFKEVRMLMLSGVIIRSFYNQGEVVDRIMYMVFTNLIEGGLLVTFILFVFFCNLRVSLSWCVVGEGGYRDRSYASDLCVS